MPETGAYGQRFGDRFRLENVPSLVTRTQRKAELVVTEMGACKVVGGACKFLNAKLRAFGEEMALWGSWFGG
ncbi:hypothetical protein SAMN05519103_06125 [Rhizobiales bacterium GAS113]|nr:hypothetical protein SAMN05519103_06125 [Rhizobiales bacterium GAS113]